MAQHLSQAVGLGGPAAEAHYQPGVCNIGPPEITRRRRAGHIGSLATVAVFAALVAADAPPLARLLVALPAMAAASGYLQARLRFCSGFGSRGIYNFGPLGATRQVADGEARRRDRAMAFRIGVASFLIGVLVGIVAVMLPV